MVMVQASAPALGMQEEALAQAIAAAWDSGRKIPLAVEPTTPDSRAAAYRIQDRIFAIHGRPGAGWKVGAAIEAVQRLEGHDGPVQGRILADRVYGNGSKAPGRLLDGCKVECEFGFRVARPLAGLRSGQNKQIAEALVFHPAVELSDTRFTAERPRKFTTWDAIADCGGSGGFVFGDGVEAWHGFDFNALPIDARIDNGNAIEVYRGGFRRDPFEIAVELIEHLTGRGIALGVGDYLSTGSLTVPTALRRGQTFVAKIGDFPRISISLD